MSPASKDSGATTKPKDTEVPPIENHVREHTGTKRTREASLEPTPNPISTPLATKKNRLASTTEQDQDLSPDPSPDQSQGQDQSPETKGELPTRDPSTASASASGSKKEETGNVGEVRRKVQEMTWKEGQPVPVTEDMNGEEGKDLKRKSLDRNESGTLEPLSPKRVKETPSPPPESQTEKSAPVEAPAPPAVVPPPAKKPQSTFSAFSSSASPFASTSSASPFASTSSSTSKPFSTGSAFGNYSSTSSPFARKPAPASASTPATTTTNTNTSAVEGSGKKEEKNEKDESIEKVQEKKSSFGDILKESKADEGDGSEKVQMTEKDVHTGEEGEETVYQCRAKLYVMQSDGGWKERGVGALKLNVRSSDGKAPRIVMRAEGVLRLMLNVSLYVGMTLIEDGKHVRSTVFEDNERRLVTFRLGSQKAASELMANIQDHIPLESDPKSPTPGPEAGSKKGEKKDEV